MTANETGSYIKHHLGLAGRSDQLFTDDAVTLIHTTSRGSPRAVNNICLQALFATFASGSPSSMRMQPSPPSPKSSTEPSNTLPTSATPRRGPPRWNHPSGAILSSHIGSVPQPSEFSASPNTRPLSPAASASAEDWTADDAR